MRILHFSDSHGVVPPPVDAAFDVVVCSGDLLPDRRVGDRQQARQNLPPTMRGHRELQRAWAISHIEDFRALSAGKPLLFCPGNHDYYDPSELLRQYGIDARNLSECVHRVGDLRFYGFPWVPYTTAGWNYELVASKMSAKVEHAAALCNDGAYDVLVAHCPPLGILDAHNSQTYGNGPMRRALDQGIFKRRPKAYLCGHVHAAAGTVVYEGMFVSNAACVTRVLDLDDGATSRMDRTTPSSPPRLAGDAQCGR